MKKSDLKQLIKPLVKECIHEVLLEEGLLSNIVSEVASGLQQNIIVETGQKKRPEPLFNENQQLNHKADESRSKLKEHRKNLMDSLNKDAYNGVNLFEGTEPLRNSQPRQGGPDFGDPNNSGVDISSLLGDSSAIWQAIKQEQRWRKRDM